MSRRTSAASLYKLNKADRAKSLHEKDIDDTLATTDLVHVKQKRVQKKDFSKEVRAQKDIKNFIDNSEVILDLAEVTLEPIVDRLLERMLQNDDRETVTLEEIKSTMFADSSRTRLENKVQGMVIREGDYIWEQTWLCVPVAIPTLNKRHVGIARLRQNVNLGSQAEEIRFIILILCPSDVKITKTSMETARTFGTLFSDVNLRHNLTISTTVTEFKAHILVTSNEFASHQAQPDITMIAEMAQEQKTEHEDSLKWWQFGRGLKMDFMRRIPYYLDDYKDGLVGPAGTVQKTVATTLFLYFSVILPAVRIIKITLTCDEKFTFSDFAGGIGCTQREKHSWRYQCVSSYRWSGFWCHRFCPFVWATSCRGDDYCSFGLDHQDHLCYCRGI